MMKTMKNANWPKIRSYSIITLSFLLMVFKFQNCAPTSANMSSSTLSSSQVGVIDDVRANQAVKFTTNAIQAETQAQTITIDGSCSLEQEDATIGWVITDPKSGQELTGGQALCQHGKFTVELSPAQNLECDKAYSVSARLGFGLADEAQVLRSCH